MGVVLEDFCFTGSDAIVLVLFVYTKVDMFGLAPKQIGAIGR